MKQSEIVSLYIFVLPATLDEENYLQNYSQNYSPILVSVNCTNTWHTIIRPIWFVLESLLFIFLHLANRYTNAKKQFEFVLAADYKISAKNVKLRFSRRHVCMWTWDMKQK